MEERCKRRGGSPLARDDRRWPSGVPGDRVDQTSRQQGSPPRLATSLLQSGGAATWHAIGRFAAADCSNRFSVLWERQHRLCDSRRCRAPGAAGSRQRWKAAPRVAWSLATR